MFAFYNYIKNFENKLTETEVPEIQFLDTELYISDNFNVNSFVHVIMSKLKDTNYLINQLRLSTENLKNEIVEQINSNFNNYVILISKLQDIDFMIDNIDKPLQNIKKRIISEINYAEKYKEEISEVLNYLKENENQVKIVRISVKFFKLYNKTILISKEIDKNYFSTKIIGNILSNHPEEYFLNNNNYHILRKYLVDVLRFIHPVQKFYTTYETYLKDEAYLNLVAEIKREEERIISIVEDILKVLLQEFEKNKKHYDGEKYERNAGGSIYDKSNLQNVNLINNLLYLVSKIFINSNNLNGLFIKILENGLSNEISNIFDNSNKILTVKIEDLQNLYEYKYKILKEIFDLNFESEIIVHLNGYKENVTKNILPQNILASSNQKSKFFTLQFFIHLFIIQFINKLNNDKFIFNCVNLMTFKDNYNSILNFFHKYSDLNIENSLNSLSYINHKELHNFTENLSKIKTFLHSFSFFTYFQYLQNDISKLFLDYFVISTEKNSLDGEISQENFEIFLNKNFISNTNLFFNYTKSISDMFRENKLFLKILPNFLNFILQCNKFILIKQKEFFRNENTLKLINLINDNSVSKFSFEEANYSELKKNIIEYLNSLNNLILFFKNLSDENKNNFEFIISNKFLHEQNSIPFLKNSFFKETTNILKKECFMLASQNEYIKMKNTISMLNKSLESCLIEDSEYTLEGSFINEILKCEEICCEIKYKLIPLKL
jgi:hypothetical protein